tara:strand:+ start:633 stop:830 length:198 start_codon:yes stop_codon:yes gene_type:complete
LTGKHPRNFFLSQNNDFLVVVNKDANNIISFERDAITGKLSFVDEVFAPESVLCFVLIVFIICRS